MGRRNAKHSQRRGSCGNTTSNRLRYKEKVQQGGEWVCGVCEQQYGHGQDYCRTCYQELYYYCYVNNQLFVAKDDSYLDIYYQRGEDSGKGRKSSWTEGESEEDSEESSDSG